MNGREKQHRNLSFEIYNNNYYDVQVFFNMFHHLHFRVVILYLCWAVRLVGVAWTWLVQTVLWCLIQIGIQPMMIKQWRVCGEMARKRRYIFLLKSMNGIIIAASQLFFYALRIFTFYLLYHNVIYHAGGLNYRNETVAEVLIFSLLKNTKLDTVFFPLQTNLQ